MTNKKITINYKKLYKESKDPLKTRDEDIGYDLFSRKIEDCGDYIKVYSGIATAPPEGYYLELVSRSSTYKMGLILYNSVGIIDTGYRNEIIGIFYKTSIYEGLPEVNSRLMQLLVKKQIDSEFIETDILNESLRGEKGFGSSGL